MALEVGGSRSRWGVALGIGVFASTAYLLLVGAGVVLADMVSGGSCVNRCDAPERFGKAGLLLVLAVPLYFVAVILWTALMVRVIWLASGNHSGRVIDRATKGTIIVVVAGTVALALTVGATDSRWLWSVGVIAWVLVPGAVGTWLMRAQKTSDSLTR